METQVVKKPEVKNALESLDVDVIKQELAISSEVIKEGDVIDQAIVAKADAVTEQLFALNPEDFDQASSSKSAIEGIGLKVQAESSKLGTMLNAPINKLAKRSEDGGSVANGLVDLKMHVESMDPAKFDLEPGWAARMLGYLPFIGTPVKRYFTKFEKTRTVIDAIANSLKEGQKQLERDNTTLLDDQKRMRQLTKKLMKTIQLAELIDQKLSTRIERELTAADPRLKFIKEELLFPLRQRIMDLQQQLIVNQQGIVSIELISRNNKELIRGVARTLNVTMSALQVGATLAIALADQKMVLDKVNAVNETTNSLIKGTAERLKTQGVEIQKQASSTQLDMAILKQAFSDIKQALDDISTFRQEALPKMASSILEMDHMTIEQEKAITNLEQGNVMSSPFDFTDE